MLVSSQVVLAAADLIVAGLDSLPVEDDADWHGFDPTDTEALKELIDEIDGNDMVLACRAAATRLARRAEPTSGGTT